MWNGIQWEGKSLKLRATQKYAKGGKQEIYKNHKTWKNIIKSQ